MILPYDAVSPYLLYPDAEAALEWLERVFGFRERLRWVGPDGRVGHAEMIAGDGMILLGSPGPDYEVPATQAVHVHVYVDDVDAHHAHAAAAGAEIAEPPADHPYGDRRYDATDLAGHRWSFATRVREVTPEEWGAIVSER